VSDAGMPGISDPGFRLVALAIDRGVPVVPVPGPAAFVAALVASGLAVDAFTFRGFLPPKAGQRRTALENIRQSTVTEVFYESPHRICEALEDIVGVLGAERRIVLARELTKLHEEFLRGTAGEVLRAAKDRGEIKGEIVLLIGPSSPAEVSTSAVSVADRIRQLMREEGLDERSALKRISKERRISKSEAYREWQQGR